MKLAKSTAFLDYFIFFFRIPDNMVYIRVPPNSEDISQTTSIGGSRRMSKTTIFKDVQNEGKKGQNVHYHHCNPVTCQAFFAE